MIIKSFELDKIKSIKKNLILIYGSNQGYKNQIIKEVFTNFFKGEILRFDENEILNNQEEFISNLMNKSLFENEKLIIISRASDKILRFINEIIERNIEEIKIIINSDNLEKKSKLRNLFEKEKELMCIPFYEDNDKNLSTIAQNFFRQKNIKVSQQTINLLVGRSRGDRGNLNNELNKIENLSITKKNIDVEDILKLTNLSENYSISELVDNCLAKNKQKTIYILSENNFSLEDAIIIIRTFLIKSKRLLKLCQNFETDKNFDKAILNFKPPIFWKEKEIVKQQMKNWSLKKTYKLINEINDIELNLKKNSLNSLEILFDFILTTTRSNN